MKKDVFRLQRGTDFDRILGLFLLVVVVHLKESFDIQKQASTRCLVDQVHDSVIHLFAQNQMFAVEVHRHLQMFLGL